MANPFANTLSALEADHPRGYLLALTMGGMLLVAWGAWSVFAEVTVYEQSSSARLEVGTAGHPLQASVAGTVLRSHLALDRWVEAGELLVELDATKHRLALEEVRAEQASLQEQIVALEREVEAEQRVLALLQKSAALAVREATAKRRERQITARHAGRKAAKLARLRREGHISELDFLDVKTMARREQASVDALGAAIRREQGRHEALEEDRRSVLEKLNGLLTRTRGQLTAAGARIKRLEHEIKEHELRAVVSGRLGEVVSLVPGRYVERGERLATIVPSGELRALAKFQPAEALGRVRRGQPARIRLIGFPWLRYGSIAATVSSVASEIRDGFALVELRLDASSESTAPLQHGLPANVEIEIDRVTPAELVLRSVGKLLSPPSSAPAPEAR